MERGVGNSQDCLVGNHWQRTRQVVVVLDRCWQFQGKAEGALAVVMTGKVGTAREH